MTVADATGPTERRAQLVLTAGGRQWAVDVPLQGDSVDAAMVALSAAVQLLARRIRPEWAAEASEGRLRPRRAPARTAATRRRGAA